MLNIVDLKLEGNATYLVGDNLALGVNDVVNLRSQTVETIDYGLNWVPAAGAQVGLRHESGKVNSITALKKFSLLFNHAATANQTVGTEFNLDWEKKVLDAKIGLLHRFNTDTFAKLRVNNNG